MVMLVAVETVALALMALLVAGLLRSHAEILRRLEALDPGGSVSAAGDRPVHGRAPVGGTGEPAFGDGLPEARHGVDGAVAVGAVGTRLEGDGVRVGGTAGGPT